MFYFFWVLLVIKRKANSFARHSQFLYSFVSSFKSGEILNFFHDMMNIKILLIFLKDLRWFLSG